MIILCEKGGGGAWGGSFTVFALFHLKDNYFYDHFIYWQLILQFNFPWFPLDNMHNVQFTGSKLPNMCIAAIDVYFQYLDNSFIT